MTAVLHPSSGLYLLGRVTLTNITNASTNATLIFHILKCKDEMDYICKYNYYDIDDAVKYEESETTRILVKASSTIPDRFSRVTLPSNTMEKQGNNLCNFLQGDTVTTTHLQSAEQSSLFFREGDTVMFTCSGNTGKPPGKLVWRKTFHQHMRSITYSNETTATVEIAEICSFRGTTNLTIQITAEDLKAKIRCAEESQIDVQGLYVETQPLNVHCEYSFTLSKFAHLLFESSNESYEDVVQNNSGVYICEAENIIENVNYRNSNPMEIEIVYVIPVICAVLSIVTCVAVIKYCCICPKRQEKEENCSRKFSFDGITFNPEYTSVILTNNTTTGEKRDTLAVNNRNDDNKSKSKYVGNIRQPSVINMREDLIKTVDVIPNMETTSFHTPVYAVPSDALQVKNVSCKIPPGMTSFKD
ncbi:unnamed protein product [Mytilus coruscus]|uniref:Ig-like domain-containing protein n=1 Tax=Mytilus coruscus TaxID=42192 RepID=A0A6J8EZY6_MYTCO|nr:unnamed protein product [Mytilus coruscus]